MSGFRESRLPPVTKPLIKVQKAGFFKKKEMFANFNKYACDFISVDDFCYVNTDDVEKATDIATVEVDKVDSQGGICYWEISILTPFIECDNIPEAFVEKYPEVRRSLKNSK